MLPREFQLRLIVLLTGTILLQQAGVVVLENHFHFTAGHTHDSALEHSPHHSHAQSEIEHSHLRWIGPCFTKPAKEHASKSQATHTISVKPLSHELAVGETSSFQISLVDLKLSGTTFSEDLSASTLYCIQSIERFGFKGRLRDKPLLPPPKA